MIDEIEFWGLDSSSGQANADALRQAEESEPAHLPPQSHLEPPICLECRKRPQSRMCEECTRLSLNKAHATFTGEP